MGEIQETGKKKKLETSQTGQRTNCGEGTTGGGRNEKKKGKEGKLEMKRSTMFKRKPQRT